MTRMNSAERTTGTAADQLLTLPEAARLAGCPESAIRRAIRQEELPAGLFGRAYAIRESDLREWLARRPS